MTPFIASVPPFDLTRHLVAEAAISLRQNRGTTLVVPMTLINADYRREIFGRIERAE